MGARPTTEKAPEFALGQRVQLADGTTGRIARKTATGGVIGKSWNYWIVADDGERVGDGKLVYAGTGYGLRPRSPAFVAPAKPEREPVPAVLPGYADLLSDKQRRKWDR